MSVDFIDNYKFGKIQIKNKNYTEDMILLGKKIIPNWWRESGNNLNESDLQKVINYNPDLLIIGTGNMGNMIISQKLIKNLSFKVKCYKTTKAVEKYNVALNKDKKVAGAFHLTC
ncbi:MAG: MTH938/NDUFAF3 family protein [Candidatus Lokiarchaeota archaeon]